MVLPKFANQSVVIDTGKQFCNYFIKDTQHLEEVMAVFFFFNFLLTHHLDLQSCAEVHFSWADNLLSHDTSFN